MSEKIKVYIENNDDVRCNPVEIEISPDSTINNFTKKVAQAFWAKKSEAHCYYKEFRLVWNSRLINLKEHMKKKISSLDRPITNGARIKISFFSSSDMREDILSWDVLPKRKIKTFEEKLPLSGKEKKGEEIVEQSGKQSSWPWARIIVGIIDLLLLLAAIATFLLFFLTSLISSIVIPIVLTFLFLVITIVFLEGNSLLPKSLLGKIDLGTGFLSKDEDKNKDKEEQEGKEPEQDKEEKNKKDEKSYK